VLKAPGAGQPGPGAGRPGREGRCAPHQKAPHRKWRQLRRGLWLRVSGKRLLANTGEGIGSVPFPPVTRGRRRTGVVVHRPSQMLKIDPKKIRSHVTRSQLTLLFFILFIPSPVSVASPRRAVAGRCHPEQSIDGFQTNYFAWRIVGVCKYLAGASERSGP
jgi:hypothetical protein